MKYTESHEWLDLKGDEGVMGITSHAQKELGEIVSIELPKVGAKVEKGEPICVLESTKAAVDVYAPISGEIIEINPLLQESINLLNEDAENEGWLCKIRVFKENELDHLLSKEEYLLSL